MPNQTNLKLLANNTNDLKVISAHLQDSILTTKNIANLKKNRLFLLEFNRFMWEDIEKGILRKNKRIRSILKIDNVISVQSKNINQENKDRYLYLSVLLLVIFILTCCMCKENNYLYEGLQDINDSNNGKSKKFRKLKSLKSQNFLDKSFTDSLTNEKLFFFLNTFVSFFYV
mgnify:CR=1 FL=1